MPLSVSGEGFRESVTQARKTWAEGRQQIQTAHDGGQTGVETCRALSELQDQVISKLFEAAAAEISPELCDQVSLVLLGGNGRQDIAPWSDLDVMLLYNGTLTDQISEFARRINADMTDSGMQVGFSIRTPSDACKMAIEDAVIFSSLTEARLLIGNAELFSIFQTRFIRAAEKKSAAMIKAIIGARNKERLEYGETVYLLRPNVKRSRGGLRDIHLIRWLGFIRFGTNNFAELLKRGGISTTDSKQLRASQEFLLRIRNEMHFHANKPADGLGRNEQVRLAKWLGHEDTEAMMGVEGFMREYFRYTSRIVYITDHFVNKSTAKGKTSAAVLLSPLVNRQIDEHFTMNSTEIGVLKASRHLIQNDLEQVLRLMQLACLYKKELEHETWISIRHAMLKFPDVTFTLEAARRFMALLSNTEGLDVLLRRLHEMQVLQKILPDFLHARGLLQFNEYHKYTVDEHSLRAVSHLISFEADKSTVGDTYRKIREKNVLHLAMLLHDLGKGYPEDHSEVGRRIAQETCERFGLPEESTSTIMYLVHKHLSMSHLAFRRDTNDPQTIAEFASDVGSSDRLAMLFVLTCADIKAVGPGVLTPWKLSLLTELYKRTQKVLTGNSQKSLDEAEYEMVFDEIDVLTSDPDEGGWMKNAATLLPTTYLKFHKAQHVAKQMLEIRNSKDKVYSCVNRIEGVHLYEICLAIDDKPGVFHRLSGMLSSLNLEIMSADIKKLDDLKMFFWFQFEDGDWKKNGESPDHRLREIQEKAIESVTKDTGPPRFRKKWGTEETLALQMSRPEIQVVINNSEVDTATIIDVFAYNKAGLLYQILKKVFELNLDVKYACISTYAHQIIDVLYVTDENGQKIRDSQRLKQIEQAIYESTKEFLEPEEETETV